MNKMEQAARLIAGAYDTSPIPALEAAIRPTSLAEAYTVQDHVAAIRGWKRTGWKAGLTSAAARATWHIDTPVVAAQLFAHATHTSAFEAASPSAVIAEAEYTVRLAKDVPARSRPYTGIEMADFVGAVVPSIEIVVSRFVEGSAPGLFSTVADNSNHGWLVLGIPISQWQPLDLVNQPVTLLVNASVVASGKGSDILGHPFEVVAWFANHCADKGKPLREGEVIATGACAKFTVHAPCTVTADFGPLGSACMRLQ